MARTRESTTTHRAEEVRPPARRRPSVLLLGVSDTAERLGRLGLSLLRTFANMADR